MAAQRTLPVKQITLNMALAVDSISFDAVRVALNLVANMQRLEMTVRFFIQRLEQSGISEQRRQTVSEIDYQALREKAEKATKGSYIVGHTSVNQHGNLTGVFVCQKWKGEPGGVIAECHVNCLVETDVQAYANAEFIAAFNPNVALALLDELEYYKSREERVTKLVMDNSTSWDALYKKLEAAKKRIAELEAEPVSQTCKLNEPSGNSPVTPDGWISCSEQMPVIGELNWRTSFPLLVTCEIGVIPAYYGFVSVNGDRHYGFMESLKYGDDNGNHPQTNEYGLISNVTHWMPLPEPPQEVNRG